MGPVHQDILEMLTEGPAFWAGSRPPQGSMMASEAIYDPDSDFRLPSRLHQTFRLAYLVERDLGRIKQWPLVLDEGLRLLQPGGVLRVGFSESALLSVFQFANFLQKWTGGALELVSQSRRGSRYEFSVRLTHRVMRDTKVADLSFAVVTDGRKPEGVRNFVDSVRRACAGRDQGYEILISGPPSVLDDLDAPKDVVFVPQPETFAQVGWISEKKNLLVDAASAPIIIVTHDRYEVPVGFVEALTTFGGDFDVLTPRQITSEGEPIPDWVTLSDELNWTTPAWMQHGDYHPYAYANGGAVIARTSRLRQVRWSPLLFWGQGEDVDLSRRLADAGAVLRFSRDVILVSAPPRAGFIEGFERLPWLDDSYAQSAPTPGIVRRGPLGVDRKPTPPAIVGQDVNLKGVKPEDACVFGFVFPRSWRSTPGGLKGQERALGDALNWFSFRLPDTGGTYSLYLEHGGSSTPLLIVNGASCEAFGYRDGISRFELPNAVWRQSRIVHIVVHARAVGDLVIARVRLEGDDRRLALDRTLLFTPKTPETEWLAHGWRSAPDGAQMVAERSTLMLPFAKRPASDLTAVVEMKSSRVGAEFSVDVLLDDVPIAEVTSVPEGEISRTQFVIARPSGRKIRIDFVRRPKGEGGVDPILTLLRLAGTK